MPGINRGVGASTSWDPDGAGPQPTMLVAGGGFSAAGDQLVNGIAVYDPSNGTWGTLGEGFTNGSAVYALAVLPNGDLVAGGYLVASGSTPLAGIARWNGQQWVSLGSGVNGAVYALTVLPNGDLVAAGWFSVAGGVSASNIARWDGTTWSPLGSGLSSWVASLTATPNGHVFAGGNFAGHFAEWDGTAWSYHSVVSGGNSTISELVSLPNGDVVAGGNFWVQGSVWSNVGRWDGQQWWPLGGGVGGSVFALAVGPGGEIFAGGDFGGTGYPLFNKIARWDGVSWQPLGGGISSLSAWVYTIAVMPGTGEVFAAGEFERADAAAAFNIARWNGTDWSALSPGTDGMVWSVTGLPGGGFVAGGDFTTVDGVAANHVARWDGTQWSALGAGLDLVAAPLHVYGLTSRPNGDIVAGGIFDRAGGLPVANIAAWDGTTWSDMGGGLSIPGQVAAVSAFHTLPNGDLLVGGSFDFGGTSSVLLNGMARWDGVSWSPFAGGLSISGTIARPGAGAFLELENGDLIVGGYFDHAGGVPARSIARWDGQQWSPLGAGIVGGVSHLALLPNGDIVAGGSFYNAGGAPARNIARWDGSTWFPLGSGTDSAVAGLAVLPNGELVVVGSFDYAGGVYAPGAARWDGQAWHAIETGLTEGYNILLAQCATRLADDSVMVGGNFTRAGGRVASFLAHLQTNCPATATPIATGCIGPAGPIVLSATSLPWVGGTCRTRATGLAASSLAVVLFGLTSPATPLSQLSSLAVPGCDLLADPTSISLAIPQAGVSTAQLVIPNAPALASVRLFHQFLHLELGPQGGPASLSSSNALTLTVGLW